VAYLALSGVISEFVDDLFIAFFWPLLIVFLPVFLLCITPDVAAMCVRKYRRRHK
jgi:hypothetical protein